jgi:SPP1 gp7 family putative phage head morphogenesis protein
MPSEWTQLPFEEAIAYLAGKTNLDTDGYADAQGIAQDVAFTVAKAKGDLLNDLRLAVEKAIVSGQSIDAFRKAFDQIADRYSPDWMGNGDRAWRAQLIYETNLRSAYAAGRYSQMTQPEILKQRPYWQWRHGGSKDPRPEHIALDGKVFDADQLFFQVGGYPPCGYNCRCRVFSMSDRDVKTRNLSISKAPSVEAVVDKGWGFVPGQSDRSAILAGLPEDIRSLIEREIRP